MSHGSVVQIEAGRRIGDRTSHEIVAAQLRGEARAHVGDPRALVGSIAREIERLGLVPDEDELRRRYAQPVGVPATVAARRESA